MIRSGITLGQRSFNQSEAKELKIEYQKGLLPHTRTVEQELRERTLLTRNRSQKVYKTADELFDISEKIELRGFKARSSSLEHTLAKFSG